MPGQSAAFSFGGVLSRLPQLTQLRHGNSCPGDVEGLGHSGTMHLRASILFSRSLFSTSTPQVQSNLPATAERDVDCARVAFLPPLAIVSAPSVLFQRCLPVLFVGETRFWTLRFLPILSDALRKVLGRALPAFRRPLRAAMISRGNQVRYSSSMLARGKLPAQGQTGEIEGRKTV
jgi:hypothetical protein